MKLPKTIKVGWLLFGAVSIFSIGYWVGTVWPESDPAVSIESRLERLLGDTNSTSDEAILKFRLDDLSMEIDGTVYMAHWLELRHDVSFDIGGPSWDPVALVFGYVDDVTQCEEWADWMREKYELREYRCTPWIRHASAYR